MSAEDRPPLNRSRPPPLLPRGPSFNRPVNETETESRRAPVSGGRFLSGLVRGGAPGRDAAIVAGARRPPVQRRWRRGCAAGERGRRRAARQDPRRGGDPVSRQIGAQKTAGLDRDPKRCVEARIDGHRARRQRDPSHGVGAGSPLHPRGAPGQIRAPEPARGARVIQPAPVMKRRPAPDPCALERLSPRRPRSSGRSVR